MRLLLLTITLTITVIGLKAQSSWNVDSTQTPNVGVINNIWRKGNVAISDRFISPYNSKLMVINSYDTKYNKAGYFSLNEPYKIPNTLSPLMPLANDSLDSHTGLVVNHFNNYKTGTYFKDVHNSTAEFGFFRGVRDSLGFQDGGRLFKSAVIKAAANFGFNNRNYVTEEMDIINMRLFTSEIANNPARIENFYALRMEDFRGINSNMITNGWGVFIKPTVLNNFFGGKVGIGTQNVTHKLTIEATENPLKITGLADDAIADKVLTINNQGAVSVKSINKLNNIQSFFTSRNEDTLYVSEQYQIYIHKGGNIRYMLPKPSLITGKSWRIVNTGYGTITLNCFFLQGSDTRTTIIPNMGAHSYLLFSDGVDYISLE